MQQFIEQVSKGDILAITILVGAMLIVIMIAKWIWAKNKCARLSKKHFGDDIVGRLGDKEEERSALIKKIQDLQEQLGVVNQDISELEWMRRYHGIPLPAKT